MKKYGVIALAILLAAAAVGVLLFVMKNVHSGRAADYESLPPGEPLAVATIDGEPFVLDHCKELLQINLYLHENQTIHDVIQYFVEQEVIVREAKRNHIEVTDEDVQAFIEQQIKNFQECGENEIGLRHKQMLSLLGLSETEYYQMFFETYRNELIAAKYENWLYEGFLYDKIKEKGKEIGDNLTDKEMKKIQEKEAKIYNKDIMEKYKKYYEKVTDKLIKDAKIEYLEGFD